ncbi:glycerol-3-phosphate 2-O-acyltransferase 4 [Sesbania bispinosa]|nr:glycerol-3-phosphate 2-O-acyltransferase 4 [Sesbania bispinosa]
MATAKPKRNNFSLITESNGTTSPLESIAANLDDKLVISGPELLPLLHARRRRIYCSIEYDISFI